MANNIDASSLILKGNIPIPREVPMERVVINPMNTHLWRLTPRPAWLHERLLAVAQLRSKDLRPIEIAHSFEPDDIYRLAGYKIGVQTFVSNNDLGAPCVVGMIPHFCGRVDFLDGAPSLFVKSAGVRYI